MRQKENSAPKERRVSTGVYAAAMFARKMIRGGTPPGLTFYYAATYYQVNMTEVAQFLGHRGNEKQRVNRYKRSTP